MSTVIWFCIGVCVGILFIALATSKEIRELHKRHDEVMDIAKKEIDGLEHEISVKQNIIDSLSARIHRQQRTIEKYKRITGRKDD